MMTAHKRPVELSLYFTVNSDSFRDKLGLKGCMWQILFSLTLLGAGCLQFSHYMPHIQISTYICYLSLSPLRQHLHYNTLHCCLWVVAVEDLHADIVLHQMVKPDVWWGAVSWLSVLGGFCQYSIHRHSYTAAT